MKGTMRHHAALLVLLGALLEVSMAAAASWFGAFHGGTE